MATKLRTYRTQVRTLGLTCEDLGLGETIGRRMSGPRDRFFKPLSVVEAILATAAFGPRSA